MVDKNFDDMQEYEIQGDELRSWNDDKRFKLNCMYFTFTKACKVEVQLWTDENQMMAITDLILWPNYYYEIRPTEVRMDFTKKPKEPAVFQFYVNPYFKGLNKGSFEPRVYQNSNISKLVVKKLLILKNNSWSKYALFLIRRAKDMQDIAKEKYLGQVYDLSMHFSRFCIEFSMKSIFTIFEQPFPLEHDVSKHFSPKLRKQIEKASPEVAEMLPKLIWISQQCVRPERLDLYGEPESRTPPDLIVSEEDAKMALERAKLCYQQCCLLLDTVMKV